LVAGAAHGKPFLEPREVRAAGHIGRSGVDEWAVALLRFPGDILAEVSCGIRVEGESIVRIHGSKGSITVPSPWLAGGVKPKKTFLLVRNGWNGPVRQIGVKSDRGLYVHEADEVADAVKRGKTQSSTMSWADSLGNARVLDLWLRRAGY
jgi:predicted dehydrogenase